MKQQLLSLWHKCGFHQEVGTKNQEVRDAWLNHALKDIPAGSRILDAGAGELAQKRFCTHLRYVAQDFGEYNGVGDGVGLHTGKWDQSKLDYVCDITSIPEQDGAFDALMCIEVLEHLPDPLAALREFSRLVRAGGWLILTAPFCSLTHFAPFHFYSGFSSNFYTYHLPKYGFTVVEMAPNGNFYEYVAQETRRALCMPPNGPRPSLFGRIGGALFMNDLARMSKIGKKSSELLCFGYHVLARKV